MGSILSRRAATFAVALLVLAGCGSSGGDTAAKTARVVRTTTTTEARTTTTSTTLSPGACLTLIAGAQAGTQVVTEADYTTKCGALPGVGVLAATTTTTTT